MLFLVHYLEEADGWVIPGGDAKVSMSYIIAKDIAGAVATAERCLPNISINAEVTIIAVHCASTGIFADGKAYSVDSDGWLYPV